MARTCLVLALAACGGAVPAPVHESPAALHEWGERTFVERDGLGYARMAPAPPRAEVRDGPLTYRVEGWRLIGLSHDPAGRLYEGPTRGSARPLTATERAVVAGLREGAPLAGSAPAFYGPLRATPQCVGCHGGREGELLGALRYDLK